MNENLFLLVPALGVLGLIYTFMKSAWVSKQDAGNEKMQQISNAIADGAMAFLKAEWKILGYFVVIVAILLGVMSTSNSNSHWSIALAFVVGAVFSAAAGYIGMKIATKANVRTANAARTSLSKALAVSFTGGSVMGLGVSGLAVLGLGGLFLVLKQIFAADAGVNSHEMLTTIEVLTGFSLGAESIALFARVGGGIYTKAADVGADLVGKVEAGIPEDDPRNPATIADNVGDNVGDVAGMGADLFGSYVATVLATMVLGQEVTGNNGSALADNFNGFSPILLPMLIAGIGIIFSIIGTFFVRISDAAEIKTDVVQKALNMGNWGSIILTAIASLGLVEYLMPDTMFLRGLEFTKIGVMGAIIVGLLVGSLMSIITEYYTAMGKRPVNSIIRQSATGHATNVIGGLAVGMESTFLPILVLAGGIWGSYVCAGLYGVAIAAAGMMATTAMQLAIDAFGPIADNAGGIAEMSELPKEVREKTDVLDAVGNTTAATGKGFAIASAALTSLALFAAFVGVAGITGIDIYKAEVLAALFVGGMIPFIFSSLAIRAVGEAAMAMVEEVRRQFKTIPGIMDGTGKPEYDKCVEISTEASLKKMMLPGAITIISPLLIGFIFGPEALGGFLAGATVSGVLMGMFQNNAGGAWDNAKKSFEKGVEINGKVEYKGSDAHKSAVTGDTVGDPFKDTSGPSMNILIKLMSIVSLVIAPTLKDIHSTKPVEFADAKTEESVSHVNSDDITKIPGTYVMDNSHAFIEFSVRHFLTIAKGTMQLDNNAASKLTIGESLENSTIELLLDPKTINTQNTKRDNHLLSEDFFEVQKYPLIKFVATSIKPSDSNVYAYVAKGNLTIKNVTKEIEVPFNYVGKQMDSDEIHHYTFEGAIDIKRSEFAVGTENPVVGDDVKIYFSIETERQ